VGVSQEAGVACKFKEYLLECILNEGLISAAV